MNIPFFILWGIIIVLIIIFIILNIFALISFKNQKNEIILFPEKCALSIDTLPSVINKDCCYIGDTLTASKYLKELNMVVNPVPIYYLDVCKEYCTDGFDGKNCVNGTNQEEFNKCINISKPVNCKGLSMPVAASGVTLYYPNEAGVGRCLDLRPCR